MSVVLDRVAAVIVGAFFTLIGAFHVLFGLALFVAWLVKAPALPVLACALLSISLGGLCLWWSAGLIERMGVGRAG